METRIDKVLWPKVYLDWVNNFLTVQRFAEWYGISEEHAKEIISAGRATDNFTQDKRLCSVCGEFYDKIEFEISEEVCKWCDVTIRDEAKFTFVELKNGMFRPQKEFAEKTMYPAFNTFRDARIFLEYMEPEFRPGICGNFRVVKEGEGDNSN